jgi:hypothetical protein
VSLGKKIYINHALNFIKKKFTKGLQIAAVVIGTNITKEVSFRNGYLVSAKNESEIIGTKESLFSLFLTEKTDLACLYDIQSISLYFDHKLSSSIFNLKG